MVSRRGFLKIATAAAAYTAAAGASALATPLGLPLGLQLYSVRAQLPTDFEGTLEQLAKIGYREVEAAGFFNHSAAQVNSAMKHAGLRCVSAHYPWDTLHAQFDEILEFAHTIGLEYVICSSPGLKDPSAASAHGATMHGLTLDDWRWNAENFNHAGEKVKAAGMRFGYHNHVAEFKIDQGITPYDELLRLTDPALVTMELDCGWVVVAGGNPVDYLTRYPKRFSMLHVKDFKSLPQTGETKPPVSTEMGMGVIDYKPIFAAAAGAPIRHMFVEQEEFDMDPMAALKVDAGYMRAQG